MRIQVLLAAGVAIVALAAGSLVAWQSSRRVAAGDAERQALLMKVDQAEKEKTALKEELERAQLKLAAAKRDLESMAQQKPQVQDPAPAEEAKPEAAPILADIAAALSDPGENRREDRRGRRDEDEQDNRTPEEREAERQQREEGRRQMFENIRTQTQQYLQTQASISSNTEVSERLNTIGQYMDTMFDLGQQMREAETDEDRQAIRESMRQTGEELQGLVRQQQDYKLRSVIESYGVTDADKQTQMIDSLQQLRQDPFFAFPGMGGGMGGMGGGMPWMGMMGGGGRGFWRGGGGGR